MRRMNKFSREDTFTRLVFWNYRQVQTIQFKKGRRNFSWCIRLIKMYLLWNIQWWLNTYSKEEAEEEAEDEDEEDEIQNKNTNYDSSILMWAFDDGNGAKEMLFCCCRRCESAVRGLLLLLLALFMFMFMFIFMFMVLFMVLWLVPTTPLASAGLTLL